MNADVSKIVPGVYLTLVRMDGREVIGRVEKVTSHPKGTLVVVSRYDDGKLVHKSAYLEEAKWWIGHRAFGQELTMVARYHRIDNLGMVV